jgi:hypothetical protein
MSIEQTINLIENLVVPKLQLPFDPIKYTIVPKVEIDELDHLPGDEAFTGVEPVVSCKYPRKLGGAKSFGVVIHGDNLMYSTDIEANKGIHIPLTNELMMAILEHFTKALIPKGKVKQMIIGHEHGDINGKCHFQCYVELINDTNITISPFKIIYDGVTLLGMSQVAKKKNALTTYCMKSNDFVKLRKDEELKTFYKLDKNGQPTDKVDPWKMVVNNPTLMDTKEATKLLLQYEPRHVITMFRNIQYALANILKPELPTFQWNSLPEEVVEKHPIILRWFNDHVRHSIVDDDPTIIVRRKALMLYSGERALGKTMFAKSLVNHPDYYVIFRNTFTEQSTQGKTPRLLILDDMTSYNVDTIEMWKALVSSEPTSIRAPYNNFEWKYSVPVVLTTNNIFMFNSMKKHPAFKDQVVFVEISSYLGPENTRPSGFTTTEYDISPATLAKMEKLDQDYEQKKEVKKNQSNVIFGTEVNYLLKYEHLNKEYAKLAAEHKLCKNVTCTQHDEEIKMLKKNTAANIELFNAKEKELLDEIHKITSNKPDWITTNDNLIDSNIILFNDLSTRTKQVAELQEMIFNLNYQYTCLEAKHEELRQSTTPEITMENISQEFKDKIIEEYLRNKRIRSKGQARLYTKKKPRFNK